MCSVSCVCEREIRHKHRTDTDQTHTEKRQTSSELLSVCVSVCGSDEVYRIAAERDIDFEFIEADTLKMAPISCHLLFIDTLHGTICLFFFKCVCVCVCVCTHTHTQTGRERQVSEGGGQGSRSGGRGRSARSVGRGDMCDGALLMPRHVSSAIWI